MLKKLSFTIFLSILGTMSNAQDLIHTKKQQKIPAKVISVTPNNIVYRDFGNNDGPTYEIPKNDLIKIVYTTGKIENISKFEEIEHVKSYIKKQIEIYGVDRDKDQYKISANFDGDYLIVERIADKKRHIEEPSKWNMAAIQSIHKLSLRDDGTAYLNIVTDQVKDKGPEKAKLVIKMSNQEEAALLREAFQELDHFYKTPLRQ